MENLLNLIIETTIYSSIMIMVILAIRALWMGKMSLKIISLLWIILLVRLIVPITFESGIHVDSLLIDNSDVSDENTIEVTEDTAPSANDAVDDWHNGINNYTEYEQPSRTFNETSEDMSAYRDKSSINNFIETLKNISLETYLTIIWIIGACMTFGYNAYRLLHFKIKLRESKQITTTYIDDLIKDIENKLNIKNNINIIRCKHVDMPVTFGLFKPIILLPMGFENKINHEKLELILTHEVCHIKRFDMLKNYLWLLAKSIHWFNPLVWIAYKEYRDDIEFAVDNMIIKSESKERAMLYSKSILDVLEISKGQCKAPLTLSFCNDKNKIKERIKSIAVKTEKKRSLGVLSLIIAVVMIVGCFTTACQPTPEDLVVQNKDKDELMEAIQAEEETSPTENSTTGDTQIQETQDVSIEHWTQTVNSGEGTVEINIDADIITPVYEQLPVVSLMQKTFSDSEMANIVTALVGDREVYEYVSGTTRADIDEHIIKTKMEMTDLNSDMASSAGVETLEELAEIGNQELERLEALLPSAPESIERSVADKNNLSQLDDGTISLQVDFDKGDLAKLSIRNNLERSVLIKFTNTGNSSQNPTNMFFSSESEESSTLKISKQEVESIAYELLNKLPAESMDISNIEYGFLSKGYGAKRICYMVSVSRCVNGMYTPNILSNDSSMESETSTKPVKPEYMNIYIDDSGIIGFIWSSPMETQEIINENVQILEFEDIKEYFTQQFLNKYSYELDNSIEYVRYDITEITLNLARIKMPDNPDTYMLVPVWDFFGERCVKYSDSSFLEREKESLRLLEENGGIQIGQIVSINDNDERVERFVGTTYMTINALNGASINRNLGY